MQHETPSWQEFLLSFLVVGVFLRGIIIPWLGKMTVNILKEAFIKTEEEFALWVHFHEKGKKSHRRGKRTLD